MGIFNKLAVAAVILGSMSTAAMAADLIVDVPTPDEVMTSGWDGIYVGAGVIFESSTTIAETLVGGQGILGGNWTSGSFLLGAEGYIMPTLSSITGFGVSVGAEGRAGFLASDSVLIYGALGGEIDNTANTFATIGGGVEFKVTENLSLDAEYKYYVGLNNGWRGNHVGLSANWHF